MKKFDVVALGELLIDFIEYGESNQKNRLFEASPGGAPCNVLAMLAGLGRRTAFIGKVGNDPLGHSLEQTVNGLGIDTSNLLLDECTPTTLAFVHKLPDGDRSFSFYRNPGADRMLRAGEVEKSLLRDARIFHFGSLSMTHEPAREATVCALDAAKAAGAWISFDPNLREPLWDSLDTAREQIWYGISRCDILKISDNEIQWLTGEQDYTRGVEAVRARSGASLILVSMGREGSRAYCGGMMAEGRPFLNENTVETTGAGDTFCGCVLNYVLEHGLEGLGRTELEEMLLFANAAASLVTTRKGALRVMPGREEVEAYIGRMR